MSHDHHHHEHPHEPGATDAGGRALNEALGSAFRAMRVVMVLMALAYLASGVFVVRQHEKAIVLVFGRVSGIGDESIKGPGLHWTWPRPVTEIVRLPAERVQTLAVDSFWYQRAGDFQDNAAPPSALRPESEGYAITGDANLLHTRWALRYTLAQPDTVAFRWSDVAVVLRQEVERAVTRVTATTPIDRALRTDLEGFRAAVEREVRGRLELLALGVRLQGMDILASAPPQQVAQAFEDVTRAEMERAKQISDARAYASRALNEAQGEKGRILSEGESYRQRIVSETGAQADYFAKVNEQYRQNPAIVKAALQRAAVQRALSGVDQKFVVGGEGQEIRLQINPATKKVLAPK
jgi:membrane protease subunit HflK